MQVVERAIARIAGRQDNVITGDQLRAAGLGRGAIAHRVKVRTMQRLHVNVYLLGAAPPTPMARARAAALACGADAIVSHRSAACLYGLLPDIGGDVDVTVPGAEPGTPTRDPAPPGCSARAQDVTIMNGLRITTVARTICDLAATESARDTEHAFQEALFREVVTDRSLEAVLDREPRRRGAPVIRSLIKDPRLTRSERERRLLRLIEPPSSRSRSRTSRSTATRPISTGRSTTSSSSSTAGRATATGSRSRTTASATRSCSQPASAVMRVTDRQLTNEPIAIVARIAQALR